MLDRTAITLTKQVFNVLRTMDCGRNHWMPDLIHASKHSRHSCLLHTLARTLAYGYIDKGTLLCNFAHPYGNIFAPSRYLTPTWNLMKRAVDSAPRAISLRVLLRQPLHVTLRSVAS